MNPTVGCYLVPEDAITDQVDQHVHKLEGCAYGVEQLVDRETGELTDFWHVVRVHQGFLAFSLLPATRVGEVLPASPATIDGILKIAGKTVMAKGRHVEKRVAVVIHVLVGVAANMPAVDVRSIFEPLDGAAEHPEDDEGWVLGGMKVVVDHDETFTSPSKPLTIVELEPLEKARLGTQDLHLNADIGLVKHQWGVMMLRRLDTVDAADHQIGNEVRRAAQARSLPALVDGVELSLAETVAYDEVLRRWERHATTTHQGAGQ